MTDEERGNKVVEVLSSYGDKIHTETMDMIAQMTADGLSPSQQLPHLAGMLADVVQGHHPLSVREA